MKNNKRHIAFRVTTILIVLCLALPSAVKFLHIFAHHEHEVCLGENQSHFHEIELDCEFNKFNLGSSVFIKVEYFSLINHEISDKEIITYQTFLKSHQQLSTYLRGPPYLV